jgi:predicted esterase
MTKKHNIKIEKTATYYTAGNLVSANSLWFVLHGYGYAAEHFIQLFEPIMDDNTGIIAPEALSKFYVQGVEGKVGASWMTKSDRENEIIDYINYLNQVYDMIIATNENSSVKINILGFSQGGATASRWIADGHIKVNNFMLWCSVFPDDMNFETISDIDTFFLYGDQDQYVTEDRVKKQNDLIGASKLDIKTIRFQGKHEIPKEVLTEQISINNW